MIAMVFGGQGEGHKREPVPHGGVGFDLVPEPGLLQECTVRVLARESLPWRCHSETLLWFADRMGIVEIVSGAANRWAAMTLHSTAPYAIDLTLGALAIAAEEAGEPYSVGLDYSAQLEVDIGPRLLHHEVVSTLFRGRGHFEYVLYDGQNTALWDYQRPLCRAEPGLAEGSFVETVPVLYHLGQEGLYDNIRFSRTRWRFGVDRAYGRFCDYRMTAAIKRRAHAGDGTFYLNASGALSVTNPTNGQGHVRLVPDHLTREPGVSATAMYREVICDAGE